MIKKIHFTGQYGTGIFTIPLEQWNQMNPLRRALAIHESHRDITKGKPYLITREETTQC